MTNQTSSTSSLTVPPVAGELPLPPGNWTLDAAHSAVGFAVRHLGISKVRGVFGRFDADIVVGEGAATTSVVAVIDTASIDTGNPDRDAHCRSSDLLDVERRPVLRFESTGLAQAGEDWTLSGVLHFGGAAAEVELDLSFGGLETFPGDGTTHAGLELRGSVDRHDLDFQLGPLDKALGRRIDIVLDIQLVSPS